MALIAQETEIDSTEWLQENLADYSPIYLYAFAQCKAAATAPKTEWIKSVIREVVAWDKQHP